MKDIRSVIREVNASVFGGAKIPHSVSNPVIRTDGEEACIAFFAYTYKREDLVNHTAPRHIHGITADMEGENIKEYDCREKDFSDAEFGVPYSLADPDKKTPTREDFAGFFALFDEVRESYIAGEPDVGKKKECLDFVLIVTPASYRRFYEELANE